MTTVYYTGAPQNSKAKLVRLLTELQYRRNTIWEHPAFDRVEPVHIKNSKHYQERAGDINRFMGNLEEDRTFDRLALELMARGWGVIWNRGPQDHNRHLHVETIGWRSENYPGRVKLKGRAPRRLLAVDGSLGVQTVKALQESFGTYVDGEMSWGGSLAKAMQAAINTELNQGLTIDGKFGLRSCIGLSMLLGLDNTTSARITAPQVREMQRRLSKHGHIFRDA